MYSAIDNSDIYTHTFQGFDSFLVVDAKVHYQFGKRWSASLGVDNLNNDRYFLFHPFPQRTFIAQLAAAF